VDAYRSVRCVDVEAPDGPGLLSCFASTKSVCNRKRYYDRDSGMRSVITVAACLCEALACADASSVRPQRHLAYLARHVYATLPILVQPKSGVCQKSRKPERSSGQPNVSWASKARGADLSGQCA
jgi:hypothetical protein